MSSTRRDVKREASFSSNFESSDDDNSEKGDGVDEDEVVAAGADFLGFVDDVPGIGQPTPEIAKSLIVKLPAKKPIKSESSNLLRNELDHPTTVDSGTSSIGTYPGLIFLCRTIAIIHRETTSIIPLNSCQLGMV